MKMRFALVALPILLTACGPQGGLNLPWGKKPEPAPVAVPVTPPKPGIPEPTGASPLAQPLEIAGAQTPRATANAQTHSIQHLAAKGAGWEAVVHGGGATFTSGGKSSVIGVKRLSYAGGLEYAGVLNGKPFVLHLTPATCEGQPMTAKLRANGNRLTGCASEIAAAPAPVIPKAVAKKAPKKPVAKKPAAAATPAVVPAETVPATPAATVPATPAPVTEPAKVETPKVEPPKVETPKVETPKVETPAPAATPATPAVAPVPATNG